MDFLTQRLSEPTSGAGLAYLLEGALQSVSGGWQVGLQHLLGGLMLFLYPEQSGAAPAPSPAPIPGPQS